MSEIFGIPQEIMVDVPDGCLPSPDMVNLYALAKERKIYLDSDVDPNVMEIQKMILRWNMEDKGKPVEERKPIWMYIMSPGGHLEYMWMLVDAIESSVTPIYTVNVGVAASAAALIFLAGRRRFMSKRARVMIHEGSAEVGGDAQKVADFMASYKRDLSKMKDYILERTTIAKSTLNKKRSNDWVLDAAYCLEHQVCTDLISSMDDII